MVAPRKWISVGLAVSLVSSTVFAGPRLEGFKTFLTGKPVEKQLIPGVPNPGVPGEPGQGSILASSTFEGVFDRELREKLAYRGDTINSLLGPNFNTLPISTVDGIWFSAAVGFLSENPAIFGGNPNRGARRPIFNAIVKVMMEKAVPMTPYGTMGTPPSGYNIRFFGTPILEENIGKLGVRHEKGRIFLVNSSRQIVKTDLQPWTSTRIQTLSKKGVGLGSMESDFFEAARISPEMKSSFIPAPPNYRSELPPVDEIDVKLTECLRKFLAMEQGTVQCIEDWYKVTFPIAKKLGEDLLVTAVRGAIVGAAVGAPVGGIGAGPGAALGAINNMLKVVWNSFKGEKLSPQAYRELEKFFYRYTIRPTPYGELIAGHGRGQWIVTEDFKVMRAIVIDGEYAPLDIDGNISFERKALEIGGESDISINPHEKSHKKD